MSFDVRRLPIIGDDIAKIGQVYDTLTSDCQVDAVVWLQAAFYSAPYLAFALLKPEPIQIEMPGRRRRHRRGFGRMFKFTQLIQPTFEARGMPKWVRFHYNNLERLGWYLLVIDAAGDFAVNWTSMAYRWSGCKVPNQPWAWGGNSYAVWPNGSAQVITLDAGAQSGGGIGVGASYIEVSPGVSASFAYHAEAMHLGDFPHLFRCDAMTLELLQGSGWKVIQKERWERTNNENIKAANVFKWKGIGGNPGQYRLRITTEGPTSHCTIGNVRLEAFGQSTGGLEADP